VVTCGVVVVSKAEAIVALVAAWVLVAAGVVCMAWEVLDEVAASPPEVEAEAVSDFGV